MFQRLWPSPWRNHEVPKDRPVLQELDEMGAQMDMYSSPGPLARLSEGADQAHGTLRGPGRTILLCGSDCSGGHMTNEPYHVCPNSLWREVDRSKIADHFSEFQSCREESILSEDIGPQSHHLPLVPVVLNETSPPVIEEEPTPTAVPPTRLISLPTHSPKQPPPINTAADVTFPRSATTSDCAACLSRSSPSCSCSSNNSNTHASLEEPRQQDRPYRSPECTSSTQPSLEALRGHTGQANNLYQKVGMQPMLHEPMNRDDTITSSIFPTSTSEEGGVLSHYGLMTTSAVTSDDPVISFATRSLPQPPLATTFEHLSQKNSVQNDDDDSDEELGDDDPDNTFSISLKRSVFDDGDPPSSPPLPPQKVDEQAPQRSQEEEVSPGKHSEQSEFTFQQKTGSIKSSGFDMFIRRSRNTPQGPVKTTGSLMEMRRPIESGCLIEANVAPRDEEESDGMDRLSTDGYPIEERLKRRKDNNRVELAAMSYMEIPEGRPLVISSLQPQTGAETPGLNDQDVSSVACAASEEQSIGRKAETLPLIHSVMSSASSNALVSDVWRRTMEHSPPDASISRECVTRSKSINEFISPLPSLRLRSILDMVSLQKQEKIRRKSVEDYYIEPTFRYANFHTKAAADNSPVAEPVSPSPPIEQTYRLYPPELVQTAEAPNPMLGMAHHFREQLDQRFNVLSKEESSYTGFTLSPPPVPITVVERKAKGLRVSRVRRIHSRRPSCSSLPSQTTETVKKKRVIDHVCQIRVVPEEPPLPPPAVLSGGLFKLSTAEQTTSAGLEEETSFSEFPKKLCTVIALKRIDRLVSSWLIKTRIKRIAFLQKTARTLQLWMRRKLKTYKRLPPPVVEIPPTVRPQHEECSSMCSSEDLNVRSSKDRGRPKLQHAYTHRFRSTGSCLYRTAEPKYEHHPLIQEEFSHEDDDDDDQDDGSSLSSRSFNSSECSSSGSSSSSSSSHGTHECHCDRREWHPSVLS